MCERGFGVSEHDGGGSFPDDTTSEPMGKDAAGQRPRHRGAVVASVVSGLVVGAGTWLGLGALDGQGGRSATDQLNEWDQPGGVAPSAQPSAPWTVDWDATVEQDVIPYSPDYLAAPDVFDDGLDHSDLPPLVPRTSLAYPEAHQLTDAISAEVGLGWMLATYSNSQACEATGYPVWDPDPWASPVLDLVSPEGVHFRLPGPVGATTADGRAPEVYTVAHANLAEGWAIALLYEYCGEGGITAVQFDLFTGEVAESIEIGGAYTEILGALEAIGPLQGGVEVRLRHHGANESESTDGLFVWAPETGEVAVDLPDDVVLGDLRIRGMAGSDGRTVVLDTLGNWVGYWGEPPVAARYFLLDVETGEIREVFPVLQDETESSQNVLGLTADGVIAREFVFVADGLSYYRYLVAPWDGSEPREIDAEEAYRAVLEPWGLEPVLECPESICRLMAVAVLDGSGSAIEARDGESIQTTGLSVVSWGQGRRTVVIDKWIGPQVVAYDPASGVQFDPFPVWVPDTGAGSGLVGVFVFAAEPEGE